MRNCRCLEVEIELKPTATVIEPLPEYTGSYDISVTNADVVIPIDGKKATDDITVHQGIPLYDGQTSVSVTNQPVTLPTHGKRLEDDITIDQGYGPYAGVYDNYVYAGISTLPTKNKYLTDDLKVQIGYPRNEEPREYTVLDNDVTIHTQNSFFPYGDRFNITVHQGYPEYDGETEKTLLVDDCIFNTAGQIVKQNLKAKLGYEVIHGGIEITVEEWVSEGAIGQGDGGSGTGESTLTYRPKEYIINDSDVSILDPVAYPGGIVLKQGYPRYMGSTDFQVVDTNITVQTSGKRLNSDITIDISDIETLADEISEVVG